MVKYTKEKLINLFDELEKSLNKRPTRDDWENSNLTPSIMPIRIRFGNWTNFVLACGKEPLKSEFTAIARVNSVKARKGKKGGNNKGGRFLDRDGYIQIWKPDHPNCRSAGYLHEHRFIMSEHLGRPLIKGENVHHINGDRSDNRIENLELWTTNQPSGQRVEDKVNWAKEFLKLYGYEVAKREED